MQLFHAIGSFFLKSAFVVYLAWIFHIKGIKNRDFLSQSFSKELAFMSDRWKYQVVSLASEIWSSRFPEHSDFLSVICRILWLFIFLFHKWTISYLEVHSRFRTSKFCVALIKIFIMIPKISYLSTHNCSIDWK